MLFSWGIDPESDKPDVVFFVFHIVLKKTITLEQLAGLTSSGEYSTKESSLRNIAKYVNIVSNTSKNYEKFCMPQIMVKNQKIPVLLFFRASPISLPVLLALTFVEC